MALLIGIVPSPIELSQAFLVNETRQIIMGKIVVSVITYM
jgi:hypothetical protein